MLKHFKLIDRIMEISHGNIEEAEKYVKEAHRLRHDHRMMADWCIDMAKHHLNFNERGELLLDELCRELGEAAGNSELMSAMRTHVHDKRGWMAEETAEIRTMIEMYGR